MKLRFECRQDTCPALIEYRPIGAGDEALDCPRCGRSHALHHTSQLLRREPLETCALCGGSEFFVRKDFPQKIGLLIVVTAAGISFLSLRSAPGLAYGVLAAAVLIDLLIYYIIGVVTVCYRCRTQYWGVQRNARHDWFDLATSEKYH